MAGARRVGLFGGTFDPPHIAHVLCASTAAGKARLDDVILTVAGDPYQKEAVASPEDRYAMTCLSVAGNPELSVSRMEIDRAGPTYAIDTVEEYKASHPGDELFLIGGSDSLSRIQTWHEWERLVQEVGFVVIPRPSAPVKSVFDAIGNSPEIAVVAGLPELDISSTDIRARIAEKLPVGHLLPSKVVAYIREHGLYVSEKKLS